MIAYTRVFVIALNTSPLKAGMTISNEPGYYADGKFGIRIESIVLVHEVNTPNNFGDKGFLGLENVTMYVFFSLPFAFPLSYPPENKIIYAKFLFSYALLFLGARFRRSLLM